MSDDRLVTTIGTQDKNALLSLEQVLIGYELPGVYNEMLIRHWMDVANAILEQYGEESDSWRRMIWFSRIVCNSILTSLEQGEAEPLEGTLKTFMTWLGLCNQETGSLELAQVAAQYLCKRLKKQMADDVGAGEGAQADVEETLATQASALAATPRPASQTDSDSVLEVDSLVEMDSMVEPEPVPELESMPELEPMPGAELEPMAELEPEPMLEMELVPMVEPEPEPEPDREAIPEPEQEISLELEPMLTAETELAAENSVTETEIEENKQSINTSTGRSTMDIPTLAQNPQTGSQKEAESAPGAGANTTERRGKRQTLQGPIPIGVWLGFHDEDISTMAKLAVYDRANDNYIFANKQGFLVRQLSTPELLGLIEDELIDIIERRVVKQAPTS